MLYKVTEGSWKGQVGELVREETAKVVEIVDEIGTEVEKVSAVVLRMAAGRLVEFKPEHVDKVVEAEPEASK